MDKQALVSQLPLLDRTRLYGLGVKRLAGSYLLVAFKKALSLLNAMIFPKSVLLAFGALLPLLPYYLGIQPRQEIPDGEFLIVMLFVSVFFQCITLVLSSVLEIEWRVHLPMHWGSTLLSMLFVGTICLGLVFYGAIMHANSGYFFAATLPGVLLYPFVLAFSWIGRFFKKFSEQSIFSGEISMARKPFNLVLLVATSWVHALGNLVDKAKAFLVHLRRRIVDQAIQNEEDWANVESRSIRRTAKKRGDSDTKPSSTRL